MNEIPRGTRDWGGEVNRRFNSLYRAVTLLAVGVISNSLTLIVLIIWGD